MRALGYRYGGPLYNYPSKPGRSQAPKPFDDSFLDQTDLLVLTETGSPYLSPQTSRGRENSPANVVAVVEEIARARGTTFEAVAEATSDNAERAFPGLRSAP